MERRLFYGPFLGRAVDWDIHWVSEIEYDGYAAFGDVDIDGDGYLDVVFTLEWGMTADLFFGPFDSYVGLPHGDDSARFGDFGCFDGYGATLLRDQLGPGHHAVAVGTSGGAACGVDT